MTAQERRLRALRAWAAWAEGNGATVPADQDLEAVASAGSVLGAHGSAALAWRPTLEHLLHQTRFGVNDPHLQLPDELRSPTASAAPSPVSSAVPDRPEGSGAPNGTDGLLAHLLNDGDVRSASDLKDVHLKLIVKSGLRSADEIRSFLPVGPDRQAGAIADSIAAYLGDVRVPDPEPRTSAPAVPPVRPASPPRREPAAPPAATPRPAAPSSETPEDGAVSADGFAAYEFGPGDEAPGPLVVVKTADGGVTVSWTPHAVRSVYRLVAGDDEAPYSPDDARLVLATTGSSGTDVEPLGGAVRRYQVWRNEGGSVAEAKRTQPVLHAEGVLIAPVEHAALRHEAGQVVGQWSTRPGTTAVHVYRIPRRLAAQSSGDSRFRVDPTAHHLSGIVDRYAEPGERYLYQLVVEADVDGTALLSKPQVVPLDVPARLEPVADLRVVRTAAGGGAVDLFWSAPPGGRVVVYRTRQEPAAGIGREPVSEALLAQQGALTPEDRLAHPVEAGPARSESMTGVAWPTGWSRAFFTPVVLLGDRALVGPSARFADVPPVTRPVLVERVQRQLLMFDWPDGADSVEVYRSETGAASEDALHGTPAEVTRDEYRERGGFELRSLPPRGCDLHLVSVLFDMSRRVLSDAVRVHYDGILRLGYTCTVKRPLFGQKGVFVSITAEFPPDRPPPFVLVHHPDRLPLSKFDGSTLAMVRDGDGGDPPSVQFRPRSLGRPEDADQVWRTDDAAWRRIAGTGGYVRLFVEVPPEKARRIALLDPPVPTLRLSARGGGDA